MAISQRYQDYLYSQKWQDKRSEALERDGFTCQKCRKARATQVHHKTYKRMYRERLSDLMSVCDDCHKRIHGIGAVSIFGRIGKVLAKGFRLWLKSKH